MRVSNLTCVPLVVVLERFSCIGANLCATIIVPRIRALTGKHELPLGLPLLPSLSRSGPICALQNDCRNCRLDLGLRVPRKGLPSQ